MVTFAIEILIFSISLLLLLLRRNKSQNKINSKGFPLPPGPRRRALIGNLFDIPRQKAWHKFAEWKQQFGEMVYVEALGNGILLLNTIELVNEMLQKRSSIYSDRPTFVMAGELMGLDNSIPMLQQGSAWQKQRKVAHSHLGPAAIKKYYRVQEDIIALYINSVIEKPETFDTELRLTAGRVIMSITYGLPVHTSDDVYITEAESVMKMIGMATVPGAFLVDLVPKLKYLPSWLPFNTVHKTGADGRNRIYRMISRPFDHVKRELDNGIALPSFTSDSLQEYFDSHGSEVDADTDHVIRWAAGAMYGAGGESTYATILSFILAMALFPDVQVRARDEIDRVVGVDRLPSMLDRPELPYINATIKEALRWRPALPLSIPRRANQADFYEGYYIPRETIIIPNVWAIARDEKSGIPSHRFAPERFLSSYVKETATDPYSYAFGFGRRRVLICPGKALGDNNLFLLISGLMASVDISKQRDASDQEMPLDPSFTPGLVSHPEPYSVRIVPRSTHVVAVVKERVARISSSVNL
ncbi:cytochrome P450 [Rickenella mellea]|uniref:Cytochrome P450 n=1 Tax=Rickenella mellea TaxID=50990 RepID=A0A4Y7QFF8_9AGAM|nr:cytochrome P450 [Rickenella mellea]